MHKILNIPVTHSPAWKRRPISRKALAAMAEPNPEPEDERKFKIAEAVADQVWREQQLTSNRMTWNLTFQGFLFAAFSFTFSSLANATPSLPRVFLQIVIAIGGFSVSQATSHSILASQLQRDFMKDIWKQLYDPATLTSYPRPFSVNPESDRGRRSATSIIKTIQYMWVALGVFALLSALRQVSS